MKTAAFHLSLSQHPPPPHTYHMKYLLIFSSLIKTSTSLFCSLSLSLFDDKISSDSIIRIYYCSIPSFLWIEMSPLCFSIFTLSLSLSFVTLSLYLSLCLFLSLFFLVPLFLFYVSSLPFSLFLFFYFSFSFSSSPSFSYSISPLSLLLSLFLLFDFSPLSSSLPLSDFKGKCTYKRQKFINIIMRERAMINSSSSYHYDILLKFQTPPSQQQNINIHQFPPSFP